MIGKVLVGPLSGFLAGTLIDRVGPRKPMMAAIIVASIALVGLGNVHTVAMFYVFYAMNALGYVLAGPLPNQVLLSRNFQEGRGKAMGIAYVGIGIGFFFVPQITKYLIGAFGWRTALMLLGGLVVLVAMPLVLVLREGEGPAAAAARPPHESAPKSTSPTATSTFCARQHGLDRAVGGAVQHSR